MPKRRCWKRKRIVISTATAWCVSGDGRSLQARSIARAVRACWWISHRSGPARSAAGAHPGQRSGPSVHAAAHARRRRGGLEPRAHALHAAAHGHADPPPLQGRDPGRPRPHGQDRRPARRHRLHRQVRPGRRPGGAHDPAEGGQVLEERAAPAAPGQSRAEAGNQPLGPGRQHLRQILPGRQRALHRLPGRLPAVG